MQDCQELRKFGFYKSGVYHVTPDGTWKGLDVYCDMATDGGGWLVSYYSKISKNAIVDFN